MASLDARLRTLEAHRQRSLALQPGASLIESEVSTFMNAIAHHADPGAYLAGLIQRLEDSTTVPDDLAALRSLAVLRIVHKLETET
jgi:hypothetical protein